MTTQNLLIVDDETEILESYESYFSRRGFTVSTAISGNTALQKVRECKQEIILSDLNMCDGSGLELMRNMRRENLMPEIFVLFSGDDSVILYEATDPRPDLLLIKPLPPSAILKSLQELIEQKKNAEQSPSNP